MIIPRSIVLKSVIEGAAKARGRARVRILVEVYDHSTQRYHYIKGASWATNIAGDQGEALEKGITELVKRVEKKL